MPGTRRGSRSSARTSSQRSACWRICASRRSLTCSIGRGRSSSERRQARRQVPSRRKPPEDEPSEANGHPSDSEDEHSDSGDDDDNDPNYAAAGERRTYVLSVPRRQVPRPHAAPILFTPAVPRRQAPSPSEAGPQSWRQVPSPSEAGLLHAPSYDLLVCCEAMAARSPSGASSVWGKSNMWATALWRNSGRWCTVGAASLRGRSAITRDAPQALARACCRCSVLQARLVLHLSRMTRLVCDWTAISRLL